MSKRILLSGDLAGVGKVSLTPMSTIINCAGIELASLPTTILSSHTGGFKNIYINEFTDGMKGFLNAWQDLEIDFDAIITSYFRTYEQIEIFDKFLSNKAKTFLIVDPVMADNGKLYSGFDKRHVSSMKKLCKKAELIIPNFTEANLLTASSYKEGSASHKDIESLSLELSDNKTKSVVITGICQKDKLLISYFDKNTGESDIITSDKLPYRFFGTGDMFTAIVSSMVVNDISLSAAVKVANDWIHTCLVDTIKSARDIKYGVLYEQNLIKLIQNIQKEKEIKNGKH